jgi:ABC-2 type transport system permease protein
MERMWAIIERDLRRFGKSPALIMMSLVVPLLQLVVLGHAFGGTVRHLRVAIVDQDQRLPAIKLRELSSAIHANTQTFDLVDFNDEGAAVTALRDGKLNGVLTIPPDFSRDVLEKRAPHVALITDNTDNFVSATLNASLSSLMTAYGASAATVKGARVAGTPSVDVVEVYPYVPYVQYLLPGSIVMSIFMMVMIGGGIIFIDDKARGLHEGYLVTPITSLELILGFNLSGTIKAVLSGLVLMTIGTLIAGVPHPFELLRLLRVFLVIALTSFALVSFTFLIMVRMDNPLVPRALFGALNTLMYFPSGAVYPQQAFPPWLRAIAVADPFTYSVHALKCLVLKDTGLLAISNDLLFLTIFSLVSLVGAAALFRRTL